MAPFLIKPENALRRAEELVNVGQSQAALQNLHEMMTNRRYRQYTPAHEHLMLKLVELGVELRKGKVVREALHAFKNMAQNISVAALESVVKRYLELAESRVETAQLKAEKMATVTDDLEEAELSPETMMMCTVSALDNKDRTDREVVTPWLKFLWETYRTVLDVLKNNAKLESLYQLAAQQAFSFCLKYERKTELRRLSELLRNHLLALPKSAHQSYGVNLNVPESMQAHLNTRFLQLNATTQLELWQEAFRSIEDIHGLITMAKKSPAPIMMINFYEKLTKIFLVSENHLFHAAGWSKYYATLSRHMQVSPAESTRMASLVLLSALAAPIGADDGTSATVSTESNNNNFYEFDDGKQKINRLTALLGMTQAPTRAQLLAEAINGGLLKRAAPAVRAIYEMLEQDFHPLSITASIQPLMAELAGDQEMAKYVRPLYSVVLMRLLRQLSEVYSTITLENLMRLTAFPAPYRLPACELELLLVRACKRGELSVRINHLTKTLTFHTKPSSLSAEGGSAAAIMQSQLSQFSARLAAATQLIEPESDKMRAAESRKQRLHAVIEQLEAEHRAASARRSIIERRKELAEAQSQQKEKEEARERALRLQREQELEKVRLAEEARRRELERMQRERAEIERQQAQKIADELAKKNVKIDLEELGGELDKDKLMKLQVKHIEDEKREAQQKLKALARRIDHLERAYRQEEIPLITKAYEEKFKADKEHAETTYKMLVEATRKQYEQEKSVKEKMSRLKDDVAAHRQKLQSMHAEKLSALRQKMAEQLEKAKQQRVAEVTAKREQERLAAEAERKAIEEAAAAKAKAEADAAAAAAKLAAEREANEAEKIERLRKEKEARLKDMEQAQEMALRQRRREEEAAQRAEEREREKAAAKSSSIWRPSSAKRTDADETQKPVANGTANGSAAQAAKPSAPKTGAYVIPSLRRGGSATSGSAGSSAASTPAAVRPPTKAPTATAAAATAAAATAGSKPGKYVPPSKRK